MDDEINSTHAGMRDRNLSWSPRVHVRQAHRACALRVNTATNNTIQTQTKQKEKQHAKRLHTPHHRP